MQGTNIPNILAWLWPVALLEIGLMIWALVDIARKKKVKNLNVAIWVLIIIFFNIIGPLVYYFIGRSEE